MALGKYGFEQRITREGLDQRSDDTASGYTHRTDTPDHKAGVEAMQMLRQRHDAEHGIDPSKLPVDPYAGMTAREVGQRAMRMLADQARDREVQANGDHLQQ